MTERPPSLDDERLMRYATAIARDDIDYLCGPQYSLPEPEHPHWKRYRDIAAVVIELADEEHPPPPNSTVKRLPSDILDLIVRVPYVSTACQTARGLQSAIVRHPDRAIELAMWRDIKHGECRQNNKHTDMGCTCGCHEDVER